MHSEGSMSRTAAEFLVEALEKTGVKRVYGVVGDSLNGFTDVMRRRKSIDWVHMRHEEAAAFAAGAEAHLTGSLAVCAGSCGPGNLHLVNGLYDCQRSRVPVVAIAEQMPRVLEIAMQTAISKRGVSVIAIPGDVAMKEAVIDHPRVHYHEPSPAVCPSEQELNTLANVLNGSKRITIFGGAGCAGAHAELIEFAGKVQAPILHAYRGKEFIEYDNPFDVGMTGLLGFSSGYVAMMSCDVLVMLGTDFPYQPFYPKDATIVQIDLRGEQIGRRTKVDLGLVGDIKTTLQALLPKLSQNSHETHLKECVAHYRLTRKSLDDLATGRPGQTPIHPQYVTRLLDQHASDDAIFMCDVGTPVIWAARYLTMNGRRRLLGSFNHGSMANALPQAIGAQATYPDRQVITLSGDGGLSMLMGDLLTLKQHDLPVKMIVYKNDALAFVELEMKSAGVLNFGTDLRNPDFAKIAEGAGLLGLKAETAEQVEPAIAQALEYDGPALVEVSVAPQELAMPPTITYEEAKGFSLFMLRAILSGRGDEIIDLAKENLLR